MRQISRYHVLILVIKRDPYPVTKSDFSCLKDIYKPLDGTLIFTYRYSA